MKYFTFVIMTIIPFCIFGQTNNSEKEIIIRTYIIQEQLVQMSEMFYENQLSSIIDNHQELPDSIWIEVRQNVKDQKLFLDEMVKLYATLFTLEELKEIKSALELPAMKKLADISVNEKYTNDFGMLGVNSGRLVTNNILNYLRGKGYIKK